MLGCFFSPDWPVKGKRGHVFSTVISGVSRLPVIIYHVILFFPTTNLNSQRGFLSFLEMRRVKLRKVK